MRVIAVAARARRVALVPALRALRRAGITSLMVEGGSAVLGAFLEARLLDRVALFRSPLLLGGQNSTPAFGGADPRHVSAALRLRPAPSPSCLYEVWYPILPRRVGE